MDYKIFAVCLFAIAGAYLMVSFPVVLAADVNIYFNGQKAGSAQISPQNVVSREVQVVHQESDISWSNTKVLVRVSTASLAHSIKKIYLYKCKKLDPNACMQTTPQTFDNWIDTELAWDDMSEQAGQSNYPQVGNILILVKLEGLNDRTSWMAFWNTIKRMDYNIFDSYNYEVDRIDLTAKSADLVQPISSYIGSFQMVPFNWVSKAVISSASFLYGGGGDEDDIDQTEPDLQTAQTPNQITSINKDYYFIFSNTSIGVTNALTMNLNPSFTCGDSECDSDLGETASNCCYDCGCPTGQYCDLTNSSGTQGSCRGTANVSLSVTGAIVPTPLQQCTSQMSVNVTARINNAPSTLSSQITGYFRINSTQYSAPCTSDGTAYTCTLRIQPPVSCGYGTFSLGPNSMNMSISFRNGANTMTKALTTAFSNIQVSHECGCPANFYCDSGVNACRSEGSILLQPVSIDSYLDDFTGANDPVKSVLRIVNAPSNFSVGSFTFAFGNITWGANSAPAGQPSVMCVPAGISGTNYNYNCSPILTIPNYDRNQSYVVRSNRVNTTITYSSGGEQRQTQLSTIIGDIVVPQQSCGNGRIDPQENQANCCRDAGCPDPAGQYCDLYSGCQYRGNISLSVLNTDPTNVSDCTVSHIINLTAKITNVPYAAALNYYSYLRNGQTQGWSMQCTQPAQFTGISMCYLTMPPQTNCSLPFSRIDANSINMSISYRNGDRDVLVREMSAQFSDLTVIPAWHCGNRVCEASFGESAANCCIDCSCKDNSSYGSGWYCNYDNEDLKNGTCAEKSKIRLVIDSPTSMVKFTRCEYDNKANITAHIENQPSQISIESYYGTLDGDTAEVACSQERLYSTASNFSLKCKMLVPAEGSCNKSSVFVYSPNTLGLYVSYRDGLGRTVTQNLEAGLPDFKSTQSFKSLRQIVDEAIADLKENIEQELEYMRELLDMIKMCIYVQIALVIVEIAAAVGVGVKSGFSNSNVGQNVAAVGTVSNAINTAWSSICSMISTYYSTLTKILEIENELIKMNMCIEYYQHQLDAGWCETSGTSGMTSCFSSLQSCVGFGSISNMMGSITGDMNTLSGYSTAVSNSIATAGNALENLDLGGGTSRGQLAIQWYADNQLTTLESEGTARFACNRYAGERWYTSNSKDELKAVVTTSTSCKYPVVEGPAGEIVQQGAGTSAPLSIDSVRNAGSGIEWTFKLKCYSSQDSYARGRDPQSTATPTIKIRSDDDNDGTCTTLSGSTGGGMTTTNLRSIAEEIGRIKTDFLNGFLIRENDAQALNNKNTVKGWIEDAESGMNRAVTATTTNARDLANGARTKVLDAKSKIEDATYLPARAGITEPYSVRTAIAGRLRVVSDNIASATSTSSPTPSTTPAATPTATMGCCKESETACSTASSEAACKQAFTNAQFIPGQSCIVINPTTSHCV